MHFEYQFRRHESSLILEMLRTGLSSCFVLFMRFYQYFSCSKVIGAMETCIKQSNIYLIWVTVAWCRFTLRVTSKSPRSFLITLNDDWRIIASQPYGVVTCYLLHKKSHLLPSKWINNKLFSNYINYITFFPRLAGITKASGKLKIIKPKMLINRQNV